MIPSSCQTLSEIINYFFALIYQYDRYTADHSLKVKKLAVELAAKLELPPQMIQDLSAAALLHDIGKMAIPKRILNKPGKLNGFEFEIIKDHPKHGYQILKNVEQLKNVAEVILYHHEKFNGTGYPAGKKGEEIPLISQILAISDVFEAITSDRCYRKAMSQEDALKIIVDGKGTCFNPLLVDTFLAIKQVASEF